MSRLDASTAARLRAAALTYPASGAARGGEPGSPPEGYERLRVRQVVSPDHDRFDAVADALMNWRVHEESGIEVRASAEVARVDAVAVLRTRVGPVRISAPCRVVAVVDEADRRGFGYGTLPGHPESGEEHFLVERTAEGVLVRIEAFSRPASMAARLAGPLARRLQVRQNRRYLAAAQTFAR